MLLAAALLLVPFTSNALAQSLAAEQAECDRVRQAAESGRAARVQRLNNIESEVKQQFSTARTCMERFGDTAARQTVTVGGFDVTPIRDALFENACNVIQPGGQQVTQLTPPSQLGQFGGMPQQLQTPSFASSMPSPSAVFERLACLMSGRCNN